jgi:hypothetical protein
MQSTFATTTDPSKAGVQAPTGGLITGDVTSPGRLLEQANQADALAEQIQELMAIVTGAAVTMKDRLEQAGWGTDRIIELAEAIADAAVSGDAPTGSNDAMSDLDGLLELLGQLRDAIGDAERLGAEAEAHDATGQSENFADA